MIGDGYAMGVAAQILEHIFGAAEGAFGVDHPVLSEQWPQPGGEGFRVGERASGFHGSLSWPFWKACRSASDKLAAKNATEHVDGKKEAITRFYPVGVIERQAHRRE